MNDGDNDSRQFHSPEDADRARVEHLMDLGRFAEAVKVAGRLTASAPDDATYRYDLARALLANGDIKEALEQCRAAIRNAPEWPMSYCLMSHIGHADKNFDLELKAAQAAVHLDPNDPWYLERLARAQIQSGMPKKAKKTAESMLDIADDPLTAHTLVGDICLELDDYKTAEARFRDAIRLRPDDPALFNDLGRAQLALKQSREAIDSFHTAVRLSPQDPLLVNNLKIAVASWVVSQGGKKKRAAALASLPAAVQAFYEDGVARRRGIQKLGFNKLMLILFLVLIGSSLIINALL